VTGPTAYEYVPSASEKMIVLVVDVRVVPPRATDHEVPVGSPVSVKLTSYVGGGTAVNVIDTLAPPPFTVTDPDEGEAV